MGDVSVVSLPCFSLDEKILQLLWDEGVQMEELLDFSFERVGKLATERGVHLDDAHKEELWLYVQRMKAEQPDWVSLSHYQDHSSRQLYNSCLEDFTEGSQFHTAQLSWDPSQCWEKSYHASFSRDSLESTALQCQEKDAKDTKNSVNMKSSKRACKTPKTFRLSKCDLSPISPKPRAPVRRSRSKVAALLSRLVREKATTESVEDRFFTRGIWPSWLNFNTTPKAREEQYGDRRVAYGKSKVDIQVSGQTPVLSNRNKRSEAWMRICNPVPHRKDDAMSPSSDIGGRRCCFVGSVASVPTDTGCRLRARDYDPAYLMRRIGRFYS